MEFPAGCITLPGKRLPPSDPVGFKQTTKPFGISSRRRLCQTMAMDHRRNIGRKNVSSPLSKALLLAGGIALALQASCARSDEQSPPADPIVKVLFRNMDGRQTRQGRLLVRAQDGGLLLETRAGEYLTIQGDELLDLSETGELFTPCSAEELAAILRQQLGSGFHATQTRHYVIVANTTPAYARWCGRLLERLQTAFRVYWRRAGWELDEPDAPLPVIIFADQQQFAEFAAVDAGPAIARKKGYYSIRTNQVVLADLTALPDRPPADSDAEILRRVESSLFNLATVVHEATHQIAFNSGMHTRYADNPMWVTEGMAIFFEAPDLRSRTGWRTIGKLHAPRLKHFRQFLDSARPERALASLLANEDRFRDPKTVTAAYSESWALTYFLIRKHRKEYVTYLKTLARKPRLQWDDGPQRIDDFEAAFGGDLEQLETEFLTYLRRLRVR